MILDLHAVVEARRIAEKGVHEGNDGLIIG
jgi:hypothetical protein